MSGSFGVGYLAGMFGVVALGSVVPVLPTGAAVSTAAALSVSANPNLIGVVIGVAAELVVAASTGESADMSPTAYERTSAPAL